MLIATWNVNSLNARLERVLEWTESVSPEVLCLQETKLAEDAFPYREFAALGYEVAHHGQGQWNGVAVCSRVGLANVVRGFAEGVEADPDARCLTAECSGVIVTSVYVPNGREVGHDHYIYKLSWLERLVAHLSKVASPGDDVVVLGDWNIIPDDRDVWDPRAFDGETHVTPAERSALDRVKAWGLTDVFRELYPESGLYSYWDYRDGAFYKRHGLRIDYALVSDTVRSRTRSMIVDRNARKGTKPSDHTSVVLELTD
ncbi:MAG: exodeoxyribonuclease III [Acidimicrobiales bacterium]